MESLKRMPKSYCNLNFKKPITSWDEALPLGNGETGSLIWGKSEAFRVSIDRGDIWDKVPYKGVLEENFSYETLVNLAKEKNTDEIRRIFDSPYNHTTPTKLPAGKIVFNFGESESILSNLSISDAQATIKIEKNDKTIIINSYLHATEKVGFIKMNLPLSAFSFALENPEFSIKKADEMSGDVLVDSVSTSSLKLLHYPTPVIFSDKTEKYFIQEIASDFSYGVFVKAVEKNGFTEIVYRVSTNNDGDIGENWVDIARKNTTEMLHIGYDEAFVAHENWWKNYWNQSYICLPDKNFEKNWYLTNYFLASCSRKGSYPMPLQGVWTADNGALPPWKGDYHHDLNTQMCYYSYLKANHIDEGESFIDFLWNLVPVARKFAKSFYHSKGLCLPAVMAIDGTALGGWGMYSLSVANQLWLCQAFERHFRFTGDVEFLREKAYVYCKESMECVLGLLKTNENGEYILQVSSSPEIHDDTALAWVTPNSNYDLSLMRYVVTQLIHFSQILENNDIQYWRNILSKLPKLAINENGVLKISPNESLMESHRHHAHAMAIHPLRLLDIQNEEEKRVIDATIHNLEVLGSGLWCGYSFTWMAEFYAIQGNGNGAAYQLETFWRNCCSQNGFHLNGDYKNRGTSQFHYRPFTLEGNMCAADALQEMLLQSENNKIKLFPAIPEEWLETTVTFEDFRAENGLLVSSTMENGEIILLTLKPKFSEKIHLGDVDAIKALSTNCGCEISDDGEIQLIAGKEISFSI